MGKSGNNMTSVTEFILLGFPFTQHLSLFSFCLVLLFNTFTMTGNILILMLVTLDQRLHRPMYYFLWNLAIMDICFTNTIIPTLLNSFLTDRNSISVTCCLTQAYTYFLIGSAEFLLFAVMSVDRYLAICHPLRYEAIMQKNTCLQLIAGVWLGSFLTNLLPSVLVMRLTFCFSVIDHFFCDIGPILQNSCTDATEILLLVTVSSFTLLISFLVTFISYINIIIAVLKIQSVEGQGRAFSTCTSHAIVVTLIYGSCIFLYADPIQGHSVNINKHVALVNTVLVPFINPIIYTLRNQSVRTVFKEVLEKSFKHL